MSGILVTGDATIDHHIYFGHRLHPNATQKLGSNIKQEPGGVFLLSNLLKTACSHLNEDHDGEKYKTRCGVEAVGENDFSSIPAWLHHYSTWSLYSAADKKQSVWQIKEIMGYGSRSTTEQNYPFSSSDDNSIDCDIAVINDAALGFRYHRSLWPAFFNDQNEKKPEWIIATMSHPVCRGDLWLKLRQDYSDKLVLIVSARNLRLSDVMISTGQSWERTIQDLLTELKTNPTLADIVKCKNLLITFGTEGVLWLTNPGEERPSCQLIFDPEHLEGQWEANIKRTASMLAVSFTAGIAVNLIQSSPETSLKNGIKSGLAAMRRMVLSGHGQVTPQTPHLPLDEIIEAMYQPGQQSAFNSIPISIDDATTRKNWTFIEENDLQTSPLYGQAWQVALQGQQALRGIPFASFGVLFTVDRNEIESFNGIERLVNDYIDTGSPEKPLSLAVFGPPGSGKSFGIKQIARGIWGKKAKDAILEFNLSQFGDADQLVGAFHQIRDKALSGIVPLVFWDEFDSQQLAWLQYLLAPMQDGSFMEGQLNHPIGKAVFIFAGGTSYTMEAFPPAKESDKFQDFKLKKGPDFVSRLQGYLNVLGPNRRQIYNRQTDKWDTDPTDICFPIRRALLLRVMTGTFGNKRLNIDSGLLNGFLKIPQYKHGARSMNTIVSLTQKPGDNTMRRSSFPAMEQVAIHIDYLKFMDLIIEDHVFKASCRSLAPAIHNFYRELAGKEGWKVTYDVEWEKLPAIIKEDNVAASLRIPEVLSLIGLEVIKPDKGEVINPDTFEEMISKNIEILAQAEHDGWMETKKQNGWVYGEKRDDENKIHPSLIPYRQLSEEDKEKDRNAVRRYSKITEQAGFVLSMKS